MKIEFLPEPGGAAGIARQIRQSGRAYPLFGTGRLFLEKPERHRVRISSLDPTVVLYQVGDGPIALDQAALERAAFASSREEYYEEVSVQGEPIKGNFSNVARSRSTGALLGPTSYHSYQPALRRIYEERFSRRMSFQDFLYQDVEIRTDEQTINDWKEQARSSTTWKTRKEETPLEFKTIAEVEQHFRTTYLRGIIKAGLSLECSGPSSRALPDRALSFMLRDAWEREKGFPGGLVNQLRPYLVEQGLHFFKHRKRILYVSANKPQRHQAGEAMSSSVTAILQVVESTPKCTRRMLATKILGEQHDTPEKEAEKEALARDLMYLIHAGHVIEFHDATLDLPLAPQAPAPKAGAKGGRKAAEEDEGPGDEEAALTAAAESSGDVLSAMSHTDPSNQSEPANLTEPTTGALESEDTTPGEPPLGSLGGEESAGAVMEPVVVTPETEAPAATMSGEEGAPEPSGDAGLSTPATSLQEHSAEPLPEIALSYSSGEQAILPGAESLAEEAPSDFVTPAEIVILDQPAPLLEQETAPEGEGEKP